MNRDLTLTRNEGRTSRKTAMKSRNGDYGRRRRRELSTADDETLDMDEEIYLQNVDQQDADEEESSYHQNFGPATINSPSSQVHEEKYSDNTTLKDNKFPQINGNKILDYEYEPPAVQRGLWISQDDIRGRGRRGRFARGGRGARGSRFRSDEHDYLDSKRNRDHTYSAPSTSQIELGKVVTIRDQFGFLRCAHRSEDIFFHLSEAPNNIKIGDEFEFFAQISGRSRRECATELTLVNPSSIKLDRRFPGIWNGKVERDIHVSGGPSAYLSRKKSSRSPRMDVALDGLVRISRRVDEQQTNDETSIIDRVASFALLDVLSVYNEEANGESQPLLAKGDEVEFQVAEENITGRLKAVSIRLIMTARNRKDLEDQEYFEQSGAPREVGEIRRINVDYGFIQCATRAEQLYFSVAALEIPPEFGQSQNKADILKEGMCIEFWASEQSNRDGKTTWRAVGTRLLPLGSSSALQLYAELVKGTVVSPPTYSKDSRRGIASFERDSNEPLKASFFIKDICPGLADQSVSDTKIGIVRLEVGDEVVADLYQIGVSGHFCARNVVVTKLEGPRLEGHVINLHEKEGFGFIKLSFSNLSSSQSSNIFFHIGDVYAGASELYENVEVRFTLATSNRLSDKPRATQVEVLPRGTLKILSHGGPRMLVKEPTTEAIVDKTDRISTPQSIFKNRHMTGVVVREATSSPHQLGSIEISAVGELPEVKARIVGLFAGLRGQEIILSTNLGERQIKKITEMVISMGLGYEISAEKVRIWKANSPAEQQEIDDRYQLLMNTGEAFYHDDLKVQTLKYALADVESSLIEGPIEVGDIVEFDKLKCDGRAHGESHRAAHVMLQAKARKSWGVVSEVHYDRHFGFIICAMTAEKIFFHLSEVTDSNSDNLKVVVPPSRNRPKGGRTGSIQPIPIFKGQEVSFLLGVRHGKSIGLDVKCLPSGYMPVEFQLEGQYIGAIIESPRKAVEGQQGLCDGTVSVLRRIDVASDGSQAQDNASVPYLKSLPVTAEVCDRLPLERGEIVKMGIIYNTFVAKGHFKGSSLSVVRAVDVVSAQMGTLPVAAGKVILRDANHLFIRRSRIKYNQDAGHNEINTAIDYFPWVGHFESTSGSICEGDEVEYMIPAINVDSQMLSHGDGTHIIGINKILQFGSSRYFPGQLGSKLGAKTTFGGNQFRIAKGPDGSAGFISGRESLMMQSSSYDELGNQRFE